MTTDEYQTRFYCNCPKCSQLPTRFADDGNQFAICESCGIKWRIAHVLDDCERVDSLATFQQVIA